MPGLYNNFQTTESDYIPQYVGMPIAQAKEVADQLQERHYNNLANLSQLQLMGLKQKAETPFEADKATIDKHLGSVQSTLEELAQNGAENSTAKVAALANQFLGNEELIRLQHNAGEYRKDQETERTLKANGHTPIRNEKLMKDWMTNGSFDPQTGKVREFKSTVQPQLDYMKAQDEVVKPIQADSWESDLKAAAGTEIGNLLRAQGKLKPGEQPSEDDIMANMPAFLQSDTYKQLTKGKVDQYLFGKATGPGGQAINGLGWTSYKSTPEYKQQSEILGKSDQEIAAELQSRGEAKVFSEHTKQFQNNPALSVVAGRAGKGTKAETYSKAYTELFKVPEGSLEVDASGNIVKADKNLSLTELFKNNLGEGKFKNQSSADLAAGVLIAPDKAIESVIDYFSSNNKKLTKAQDNEIKAFQYALDRTNESLPAGQKMDLKEFVSKLGKDMNVPMYLYDNPDKVKDESFKYLNTQTGGGSALTRKVYTTDGEELTSKEFFKKTFDLDLEDMSEDDMKKFKEGTSVIGVSDPKNLAYTRALVGTFKGKKFLIDDSENASPEEIFIHDTYKFGRQHGTAGADQEHKYVQTVDGQEFDPYTGRRNPNYGKPISVQGHFDANLGQWVTEKIVDWKDAAKKLAGEQDRSDYNRR